MRATVSHSSRALVASVVLISAMLAGCESVNTATATQSNVAALSTGSVYFGNEYGSDQAVPAPQPAFEPQAF